MALNKTDAFEALEHRRDNKPDKIDNGALHAGEPMYFYCKHCGALSDVLPEEYVERPKKVCDDCQKMVDEGWLK